MPPTQSAPGRETRGALSRAAKLADADLGLAAASCEHEAHDAETEQRGRAGLRNHVEHHAVQLSGNGHAALVRHSTHTGAEEVQHVVQARECSRGVEVERTNQPSAGPSGPACAAEAAVGRVTRRAAVRRACNLGRNRADIRRVSTERAERFCRDKFDGKARSGRVPADRRHRRGPGRSGRHVDLEAATRASSRIEAAVAGTATRGGRGVTGRDGQGGRRIVGPDQIDRVIRGGVPCEEERHRDQCNCEFSHHHSPQIP